MFRKVTISRSIRTLGTMLASGVPCMEAIRLAGEVAGNYYYEQLWANVLDEVTGGKRICEVLRGNPLFPRVLVQMIASGEETGKLDDVLERVSTYYDQEVETSLKATTSLIEPIMISVMGVVVGTIGLALLLPIFSLSKQPATSAIPRPRSGLRRAPPKIDTPWNTGQTCRSTAATSRGTTRWPTSPAPAG